MPRLIFSSDEIITYTVRSGKLKADEADKGRLAVGREFFKDYDPEKEEIWIIRRIKTG
jgi:hypothetical protein